MTVKTVEKKERPKKQVKLNRYGNIKRNSRTAVKTVSRRRRQKFIFNAVSNDGSLKYISTVPLRESRDVKLPKALLRIVPKEVRETKGAIPQFAIFLDTKNCCGIIKCVGQEYSDKLAQNPETGEMEFIRETPDKLPYDRYPVIEKTE